MEEQLYSTGEFAELCGVKKQTLFHYDDIGLLVPERVDANGYRRYSHGQYQTYLLISCLKEAGMALAEIKDFLEEKDPERKQIVMQTRLAAIDDRISYLMRVRRILAGSFSNMGAQLGTKEGNDDEIRLVERPELALWASARLDEMDDRELVETTAAIVKQVEPYAVCLASEDVMAGQLDSQRHLLIMKNEMLTDDDIDRLGLHPFIRPAGRYGVTDQQPGETPEDIYLRLIRSMEDFGEHPGEFFYEEYPSALNEETASPLTVAVQLIPNE